jgi:hypothetical protein
LSRNCLLKHVTLIKRGREHKEEDVSSYWMTLRKRDDAGNWKRKL